MGILRNVVVTILLYMSRLLLLFLFTQSYSQPIQFYHYIGSEKIENSFLVVEDGYKLNLIKFGLDTINMSFTRVDLDEGHIWYYENFKCLELEITREFDRITELAFFDAQRKQYYKYYRKSIRI